MAINAIEKSNEGRKSAREGGTILNKMAREKCHCVTSKQRPEKVERASYASL